MLNRNQIEKFAENYLIKYGFPINIGTAKVTLPEDTDDEEQKSFLLENGISMVSYVSKYLDDPAHELEPAVYIVYVDLESGEVHMPRHM